MSAKQDYLSSLTERVARIEKKVGVSDYSLYNDNCFREEQFSININKDLVARSFIVVGTCESNKIVATNEHRQLSSINLTDIIKINDINLSSSDNNGIMSIQISQNPIFQSIKVTNSPDSNDNVVNKEYVDTAVSLGMRTDLNLCKRLDVLNPTGECLRFGRDDGTCVNVNVDANGTLNLSSTETNQTTNDIDIFAEKINLLSNINSSTPNDGSFVLYGGMGVMKDLNIGGGLTVETYNGIPTKFKYYEEGALQVIWTGIWENPIDSSFVYQRCGGVVTLMIPYIGVRSNTSDIITNTAETYLPKRLRPIYDIPHSVDIVDNDGKFDGVITIYGNDGRIVIKPKNALRYSGAGISGFYTVCVQYMVDTKKLDAEDNE